MFWVVLVVCPALSILASILLLLVYGITQNLKKLGAQFVFCQGVCDLVLARYEENMKKLLIILFIIMLLQLLSV